MSAPESDHRPYALVVDDDPIIRMDACDIFDEAGFETLEARDLASGLSVLEKHCRSITLLFTDVQMTGPRDGFELALTAARCWPHIGIVVASGHARPGPHDLPDQAHFIEKPFSAEVVHEHIRGVLSDGQLPEALKA